MSAEATAGLLPAPGVNPFAACVTLAYTRLSVRPSLRATVPKRKRVSEAITVSKGKVNKRVKTQPRPSLLNHQGHFPTHLLCQCFLYSSCLLAGFTLTPVISSSRMPLIDFAPLGVS